jgi:hypothetical protein
MNPPTAREIKAIHRWFPWRAFGPDVVSMFPNWSAKLFNSHFAYMVFELQ